MKLIIAILRDTDNEPVSKALNAASFRVTCVASTSGFLRHGRSTLLIGLQDDQVQDALAIIRKSCSPPPEPNAKCATIFVIKVDDFLQV
jgi:uncharacterized protein YaaQ